MSTNAHRLTVPAGAGYQPGPDISPAYAVGLTGELSTVGLLDALQNGSAQVKTDERARDRAFVEFACRWADGNWHDSGVRTETAATWVMVFRNVLVAIETARLRRMAEAMICTGHWARGNPPDDWGIVAKPAGRGDEWPTKGVVVPFRALLPWVSANRWDVAA